MRNYDRNMPLIGLHIPKTAGITSKVFFQNWYGKGFLQHYFDESNGKKPQRYNLSNICNELAPSPIMIYGHFNSIRGFGVKDYYPDITQFITIMREPFEQKISSYFFIKKTSKNWLDQSRSPEHGIEHFLINTQFNMLNHFPQKVTIDNYKEIIEKYFIEIGVTEYLNASMKRIAQKLGFPYDENMLERHNTTERNEEVPLHLKDMLREKNELEFIVYEYVSKRFN